MTDITNSSIQAWIDLNNFASNVPPKILPCQEYGGPGNITLKNCTAICNDTVSLVQPDLPNNLLTCGLFASMTLLNYFTTSAEPVDGNSSLIGATHAQLEQGLTPFRGLGLDGDNQTYASAIRSAVSGALTVVYRSTRIQTYSNQITSEGGCSEQNLYPYDLSSFTTNVQSHLATCINAICAPRSLNPDLGGIGVFVSLLLQLCIAIIFFLILAGLELFPTRRERATRIQRDAFATAVIEFHKNQCYFIAAIEIAALVLARQAFNDFRDSDPPPIFDVLLALPLAVNGMVPIVFTLCSIVRYGRLSWHILLLSTATFILSTGNLAASIHWAMDMNSAYGPDGLAPQTAFVGYSDDLTLAAAMCGSKAGNLLNVPSLNSIRFSLLWAIFANCLFWLLCCIFKQIHDRAPPDSRRARLFDKCKRSQLNPWKERRAKRFLLGIGYTIFFILWALSFIYHFYVYGIFVGSNLVPSVWTFGQIISVTVWLPFLFEFAYIEYEGVEKASRYKYPPGLQVTKIQEEVDGEGKQEQGIVARHAENGGN